MKISSISYMNFKILLGNDGLLTFNLLIFDPFIMRLLQSREINKEYYYCQNINNKNRFLLRSINRMSPLLKVIPCIISLSLTGTQYSTLNHVGTVTKKVILILIANRRNQDLKKMFKVSFKYLHTNFYYQNTCNKKNTDNNFFLNRAEMFRLFFTGIVILIAISTLKIRIETPT